MSSIAFLPVSQTQKNAFNLKELNKRFSEMLVNASKSIASLTGDEFTEENIQNVLKDTIESVYKTEELVSSEKKPKAKRAKQAFTSYIYFCKEQRSVLKDEHPNATPTELTSLLAEKWGSLTEEEKQPYIDMHNEEAEELKKKRESGEESSEESKPEKKVVKAPAPVSAPKTPAPKTSASAPASKAPATKAPAPKAPTVTVEDDDEPILQPSTDKKAKAKK